MQAAIILAVLAALSVFMLSENSRNEHVDTQSIKSANVAANIFQYQDSVTQYALANYESLHLSMSLNSNNVEQINVLNYTGNQIHKYNQKNLALYLNYQTTVFNYTTVSGESQPTLYIATTWDTYSPQVAHGYSRVTMPAVLGQLGSDLGKYLYQGNSTYWVIPWVFSQNNCSVDELFSQLPEDSSGNSQFARLTNMFNQFCNQIHARSSYRFKRYVYISPVFQTPDL